MAEYETYQPDILTVGVDVYNIEAEVLGCEVMFNDATNDVPVIRTKIFSDIEDVYKLPNIDPEKSARMPFMLQAADIVNKRLGNDVYVRGAVSGLFSMAAELVGIEPLLMAIIFQPDSAEQLLKFCTQIAIEYGSAYLKRGVEICIFDSQTSPPPISSDIYTRIILPHVQKRISALRTAGAQFIEYVVGGDTCVNAKNLFNTGADILLSDFSSDVNVFLSLARQTGRAIRRNISPILLDEKGPQDELAAEIERIMQLAWSNQSVIIGTGVLSYNTPIDTVLHLKESCK